MKTREKAIVDLFAAMESLSGPVYECRYYPCHFSTQDCSLCYCIFYPCLLYRLGGELTLSSSGEYVWSCKNCTWVHERDVVEEIVAYFSSIPRQLIVEEDWYFFSRALQEILFGEELGSYYGSIYNLTAANMHGYDCREIEESNFLVVELDEFNIRSVKRVADLDEVKSGVVIPEKHGKILRGFTGTRYLECRV